ncbi:MDR family MFS transporter [Arthrobacter sp. JSM 101049]|uniref:MDR family MFS transporter n=1 Tax=Arthrobacter sp. JSM 101049 TaxID=929097 RepID=UPI003566FA39
MTHSTRPEGLSPETETASAGARAIDPERATKGVAATITALVLSAMIMILNETVLSVALPNLMADFHVDATTAQWLTTGFLLTMSVVIPTTGFLLQRFTTRRLFAVALLMFILGTVLATIAPTFSVLLLARIVQAGGTAIILPLLMTTTLTSVPVAYRGTIMGLNAIVISVAPAIGPTLSGLVLNALNWRWVFGLMVPVAVIVFIVGIIAIRTSGEVRKAPLDVLSVVLSAVAFGGIVYALSSIGELIHGAWAPIAALVIGAIALAVFISRQSALRSRGAVLLDLRPFAIHNFRLAASMLMLLMGTLLGTVMVIPIFLQNGMGVSVLTIGLLLLPGGLVQGIISPVIGRLYDKVGPRPVVIPGAIMLAAGQWWLSTVQVDTPLGLIVAMHVVFSIGFGMLMTPLMTTALSSLPRELYGHGSAIVNTLQQLGGAAGTAILIATMTVGTTLAAAAGLDSVESLVSGTEKAFFVGGILGLMAVVCSFFVKNLAAAAPAPEAGAKRLADIDA